MSDAKLTETGRRPLRKYGTELRDVAIYIVNQLDEMREDEDTGGDMIGIVENTIWNALFGFNATIPVDKRIAGLQRDLAETEDLIRSIVGKECVPGECVECGADLRAGSRHGEDCKLNNILVKIDARKAGS